MARSFPHRTAGRPSNRPEAGGDEGAARGARGKGIPHSVNFTMERAADAGERHRRQRDLAHVPGEHTDRQGEEAKIDDRYDPWRHSLSRTSQRQHSCAHQDGGGGRDRPRSGIGVVRLSQDAARGRARPAGP